MNKIKALIFDFDGVIIDSEKIHIDSTTASYAEVGIKLTTSDINIIYGRHPKTYNNILSKKYNFNKRILFQKQCQKYYSKIYKAPIFPKTLEIIKYFSENLLISICTATNRDIVDKVLNIHKLSKHINSIISYGDFIKSKPSAEPYEKICSNLKLPPTACLAFEDSLIGITSANSAGLKCVGLKNDCNTHKEINKAQYVFDINKYSIENINKILY